MNIYQKMMEVMKGVTYLSKDDKVEFKTTKYKAISEEKVTSTVRAKLIEQGLVIFPIAQSHKRQDMLTTVDVTYRIDMSKLKTLCTDILKNFDRWNKAGKGLYLWSKTPGSGKTFLACCLAKSLMMKYDLQMRFITAVDYINTVGDSYKRDRGEADPSEVYRECRLLVLDDIGTQVDKDWQRQELFRLINKRMEDGNITIYTSNMSTDGLNVDARTRDRIVKTSVELQMPEESIRKKKAMGEQREFLAGIIG